MTCLTMTMEKYGSQPGGAVGDHRDGAGGLDGGQGGISPGRIVVDGRIIGRKGPFLPGQLYRALFGRIPDKLHHLGGQLPPFFAAIGDAELDQHIVQPHDAHADLPGLQGHLVDLGDRKAVAVDDIVEKVGGRPGNILQPLVIDLSLADKIGKVDRTEVAALVGQQPLLAAGIGRLELAQLRGHVGLVGGIDEEDPRFTVVPGQIDDLIEDGPGIQGGGDLLVDGSIRS